MLLLTGIINTSGHYARQKFYLYNQSLVLIRTFHPTTWLSDQRKKNACDSPLNAKNCILKEVVIKPESSIRDRRFRWNKWRLEETCNKA